MADRSGAVVGADGNTTEVALQHADLVVGSAVANQAAAQRGEGQ